MRPGIFPDRCRAGSVAAPRLNALLGAGMLREHGIAKHLWRAPTFESFSFPPPISEEHFYAIRRAFKSRLHVRID